VLVVVDHGFLVDVLEFMKQSASTWKCRSFAATNNPNTSAELTRKM
jgi:hypothetical protein